MDKLRTKQDYLRPAYLTNEQQQELARVAKDEVDFHRDKKSIMTQDLEDLIKIHSSTFVYLAQCVENRYVSSSMANILKEVEDRFRQLEKNGYFIIVSLTRTYEQGLRANKLIAKEGTHAKGEAADFAAKFMKLHFKKSYDALWTVLNEMRAEGKIFFTNEEDSTSFWHIATKDTNL